jgi:anti-anti-sigma regulatory factor
VGKVRFGGAAQLYVMAPAWRLLMNKDFTKALDQLGYCGADIRFQEVEGQSDALIIALDGQVYLDEHVEVFRKKIRKAIDFGYKNLAIDCELLGSSGVSFYHSLIEMQKWLNQLSGKILITNYSPALVDVVDIMGFKSMITCKETIEESIVFFATGDDLLMRTESLESIIAEFRKENHAAMIALLSQIVQQNLPEKLKFQKANHRLWVAPKAVFYKRYAIHYNGGLHNGAYVPIWKTKDKWIILDYGHAKTMEILYNLTSDGVLRVIIQLLNSEG